jgi:tetratricopeptide (TPR) repeat protein
VLELLHGLPLALTQAGSYMRETNMSAATYAEHYNSTWGCLMKKQERFPLEEYGDRSDRSVLTTWTMSYEQVRKKNNEAACLLRLWGILDHGELWYKLIAAGVDLTVLMDVPAWLVKIAKDELEYSEAIGLLSRYSLVDGKKGTESHSMHSVLHRWCGYLADKEEQHELGWLAVGLVALNVPLKSDTEFWKKRKRIMAHGLRVCGWVVEAGRLGEEGAVETSIQPESLHSLGYLLEEESRQQAEQMYQRALARKEKAWGLEHTSTLNTVNNLGILYADLGRIDKAEQMYQRALAGYEKAWGLEHTLTLDTINNLGILYADLGRLDKAEQMYQRALTGYEEAWGLEHTSTLKTVNNLGVLYKDLGRLNKAEQMYQRALAGYEKAWGPEHTSTLDTVNNLGLLYAALGRLEEAEHMYQRALAGREKAWGLEHTSTLDTVNNLGNLYLELGRLEEAEQMYQRALAGYKKAWGLEHTSTLETVNNLGNLYLELGRLEEAAQMYQRALAGKEKAWGGLEHTSTLDTVNNLGNLYLELGRLEEAEHMYQRALAGYEKAIHPDNLLTCVPALNNMWAFAALRKTQGRLDDARRWYSHALLGYEKTFGEGHKKCHALRNDLAALASEEDEDRELNASINRVSVQDPTFTHSEADVRLSPSQPASRRSRVLRKLRWK